MDPRLTVWGGLEVCSIATDGHVQPLPGVPTRTILDGPVTSPEGALPPEARVQTPPLDHARDPHKSLQAYTRVRTHTHPSDTSTYMETHKSRETT